MGFLNPAQDDDYRIAAMPTTTDVPAAGAFEGLLSAIPKGVAGGVAKLSQAEQDFFATDFGHGVSYLLPFGGRMIRDLEADPKAREQWSAATKVAADWSATGQDPRVTGAVGRIAAGTAEGLTIGAAGATMAGPWGAAGLLGGTEGYSSYTQARAQGVDHETAKEQAIITGLFSAAGALLPMKFGSTAITSAAGGAAANVTLGVAQRAMTHDLLSKAGYQEMADQYKIADGEALLADAILGSAFGVMGHYSHAAAQRVSPADVDAAAAVATEDHFNRSAPGVPTDPATATLHADTMASALRSLADGDLPDIPPERAQQLVDNVLPDPMHSWEQVPEPPPGYVRMYHGAYEGAEPHTGGSRWFATTPEYAAGYGEGNRRVWYVDVPTDHANLTRLVSDEDVSAGIRQRYGNSELPEDIAKRAKPYRPENVLQEAAQAELPGFEAATADVPRVELPPEEVPPPKSEPAPAAEGAMPDVPLDDFHGSMLDHLVHNYGDETYVTDDGRELTYRQLANEMQAQRNEADAFAKLHDVAAACALRNGV